jgi:hypothetical protein
MGTVLQFAEAERRTIFGPGTVLTRPIPEGSVPGLVPASEGESLKAASEFRPPALNRRTPRRIAKRRIK